MQNRERTLTRDVVAHQIPSGDKHILNAGGIVYIHQVLGGSYTVQTDTGLYRITGADADAIDQNCVVGECCGRVGERDYLRVGQLT